MRLFQVSCFAIGLTLGSHVFCASAKSAAIKSLELYVPTATTAPALEPLDAIATIRRTLDARRTPQPDLQWKGIDLRWNGFPCRTGASPPREVSYAITGQALTIRCTDGAQHVFPYSKLSKIHVYKVGSPPWTPWWTFACIDTDADKLCIQSHDMSVLRSLADAFYVLHASRRMRASAADADFAATVAAARSLGDRTEQQRRTVVKGEALLKQNRPEEALHLYRDALKVSPDWAIGHYNLALIYASLELYPEAITELRRYLYLAPDATDRRETQDQIYAWEAFLPTEPLAAEMQK